MSHRHFNELFVRLVANGVISISEQAFVIIVWQYGTSFPALGACARQNHVHSTSVSNSRSRHKLYVMQDSWDYGSDP